MEGSGEFGRSEWAGKTEQPTNKRRKDAREEGNLFQSKDVVTVIMLFGVFYMMKLTLSTIYDVAKDCMIRFFSAIGQESPFASSPTFISIWLWLY